MTEIADILGKDSATIRKQMERARKYLDWNEECTTTITREDMEQYD